MRLLTSCKQLPTIQVGCSAPWLILQKSGGAIVPPLSFLYLYYYFGYDRIQNMFYYKCKEVSLCPK
nr:MAG TPA: hypothetical protein [Caudoviricetes sp.]DAH19591.1 MAG TPA: hypothetical protein [Caudoviricetes sp.]